MSGCFPASSGGRYEPKEQILPIWCFFIPIVALGAKILLQVLDSWRGNFKISSLFLLPFLLCLFCFTYCKFCFFSSQRTGSTSIPSAPMAGGLIMAFATAPWRKKRLEAGRSRPEPVALWVQTSPVYIPCQRWRCCLICWLTVREIDYMLTNMTVNILVLDRSFPNRQKLGILFMWDTPFWHPAGPY